MPEMQNRSTIVRGRMVLLALWAVPFVLMSFAWLMYSTGIGIPKKTSNYGHLIVPGWQVNDWLPHDANDRWTIVVTGSGNCDDPCRHRLWFTRQIHLGLGREAARVRRVYWSQDDTFVASLNDFFRSEHPGLATRLIANESELTETMNRTVGSNWMDGFYLVNPDGFLMMNYGKNHQNARKILKDMRFLLKISSN